MYMLRSQLEWNIPAQNQDEFYEAYNVTPKDGMWLDPEDRITIW